MTLPTLQEQPSGLGSLVQGLGVGMQNALPSIQEMIMSHQKQKYIDRQRKDKTLAGASKYVEGELKRRDLSRIKDYDPILKKYESLIEEGYPQHDAIRTAMEETGLSFPSSNKKTSLFPWDKQPGERGYYQGTNEDIERNEEYPYGVASAVAKHPKESLSDIPISLIPLLEQASNFLTPNTYRKSEEEPSFFKEKLATPVTDYLRKLSGHEDLPEQAKEEIGLLDLAATAFPWLEALGIGGKGVKAAQATERFPELKEIPFSEPKQIPFEPGKTAKASPSAQAKPKVVEPSSVEYPLSKRMSSEVAETPTEMRIARTEPETRIYNRLQNVELAEKQLGLFPEYRQEIEIDASERAARKESRIPKTAQGMLSLQGRIKVAESKLPAVEKSYNESTARDERLSSKVMLD